MPAPVYSSDILAQARRRRLKRIWRDIVLGLVVAAYTYGALAERVGDPGDVLPPWLEAMLLGVFFSLASLPSRAAWAARILTLFSSFLLYLSVLTGKNPPLPFAAAFGVAIAYAAALFTLSAYLSEKPDRSRLGSRQ
jgi:hypothetical protein